jgi:ribulose-5-phosphate 4-epimerase/fuculose-1-phosphate aldolase
VSLRALTERLVQGNRILAHEGVVDAHGHLSVRHPHAHDQFLMSVSRSPKLVSENDIRVFGMDGELRTSGTEARSSGEAPYGERFIHAGVYTARPDVQAILHAHTEDVLPYTIADVPLRPVLHTAREIGVHLPLWDIADDFGASTDLLVSDLEKAASLARRLGDASVVLMRGHGYTAVGLSIESVVRACIYLARNARVLTTSLMFRQAVRFLSPGEIASCSDDPHAGGVSPRLWEYWSASAGIGLASAGK